MSGVPFQVVARAALIPDHQYEKLIKGDSSLTYMGGPLILPSHWRRLKDDWEFFGEDEPDVLAITRDVARNG